MLLNLYSYLIFIPMIYISSMMIFVSSSWFSQWMIMEINLISFLGMIIFEKKISSISMSYFLIQSFNSYIFIMMVMNLNFLNLSMSTINLFIINLCLLTKMGLPPFYMWYIKVMKSLSWFSCFYLMSIQKLIPLMIMNNLSVFNNKIILMFNMLNMIFLSFVIVLLGMQNLNLKILMSYSSIIQMTWMILLFYLSEFMLMNYMLIYFFILFTLIFIFNKYNLIYLSDLMMLKFNSNWMYMFYMFMMMAMAGIPPYFGFLMKWISIQLMSYTYSFYLICMLILNSLISMFFYLRLSFISYLNLSFSMKFNYLMINVLNNNNKKLLGLIWMMLIMLMLFELM